MPQPYFETQAQPVLGAANIVALRAVDSNLFQVGQLARITTGFLYEWQPNNGVADNGSTVIKPDDVAGLGRWVAVTKAVVNEFSAFPTISVVASGTNVAVGAGATIEVADRTRLAGRVAMPFVWVRTTIDTGNTWGTPAGPAGVVVGLNNRAAIFCQRINGDAAERYRVQIENLWRNNAALNVAINVDWLLMEASA